MFRQIERWLHQHIFKVGWLLTKNYQTTTILYYTFFLPGVVLHELVLWLAAGVLDVRADRAIQWPEKQEIGELHLNFVKLSRNAGRIKIAIISAVPIVTGLIIIWHIANNVLHLSLVFNTMGTGDLTDVAAGIQQLTSSTDFWLWIYLAFAISNTMIPSDTQALRGWWVIAGIGGVLIVVLLIVGIGSQVFSTVSVPVEDTLNVLAEIFGLIIGVNLFMTLALASIEAVVERVTGDTATFKNGKMITMRRSELLAMREQERSRLAQARSRTAAADSGPPSIYKFPFPIPGDPSKEPISQRPSAILEPTPAAATPSEPTFGGRVRDTGPLTSGDTAKTEDKEPDIVSPSASITSLSGRPMTPRPVTSTGSAQGDLPRPATPALTSGLRSLTDDEDDDLDDDVEDEDDVNYEDAEDSV